MKIISIISAWSLSMLTSHGIAQPNPSSTGRDKMSIFDSWEGHWQGEGTMRTSSGETKQSRLNETVEYRLDERLLIVEGIAKALKDSSKEAVVHHAFGVLSFDEKVNEYKFKTYLVDGRSTEAWFKVISEHQYRWGFDVPQGKIHYTIVIDPEKGTWNETGEFSPDSKTWHKFLEMNLRKVKQD